MVGGGLGSLIGPVHHTAIMMDGGAEVVAGVFSRDPEKNRASGEAIGVAAEHCYASVEQLLAGEQELDWISVMTPNDAHREQIAAIVRAGIHIVSDKPLTRTLEEALELETLIRDEGAQRRPVFALTHAYTGYPMVRQARDIVASGRLGRVYKVVVEYLQGWLSNYHEESPGPGMPWRTTRAVSGISCTTADIGTHGENLARYITGLRIARLSARTSSFLKANELDDDVTVLVDYEGGAQGVILASQVATGERNALSIRVYGELAGLEWQQEHPNQLTIKERDLTHLGYDSGVVAPGASAVPGAYPFRLPPGHPEGLIEAFANVYAGSFRAIREGADGPDVPEVPGIGDGVTGMRFTDLVIRSSSAGGTWLDWGEGVV